MTTIVILAALIAAIVFVLRMKPVVAVPEGDAPETVEGDPTAKTKKPFVLSERGKTVVLAVASGLIGLIVSMYLNPLIVFVILAAGGLFAYYRTAKGKENLDKRLGDLKTLAAKSAVAAKASAQSLADSAAEARASAEATAAARPAGHGATTPVSTEQLLDQIVSATRIGRRARKTLDAELLPSLAEAGDDEAQKAVVSNAIANSRATFNQARKLAESAIAQLATTLSADAQGAHVALEAALAKENVSGDPSLGAMFREMQESADMARFDEAGYRTLLMDFWLRTTETPGLANSPV